MIKRIVAFGQDAYWLTAIKHAMADKEIRTVTIKCTNTLRTCLANLPNPDEKSVVIVDASGQYDVKVIVTLLRNLGWLFVIVVAADPNVKEAVSILRSNLGYDYWPKTYEMKEIANRIQICVDEITEGNPKKKSHHQ